MLVKNWEFPEKKTYGYQERDVGVAARRVEERAKFIEKLDKIDKKKIIYVDKAGFDNRENYPYSYSSKEERCYALKSGKRTERVSWIGALKENILFAPYRSFHSTNFFSE